MQNRLWDARIALWIVRPLQGSWVTPNHLTTVRLVVGLISCAVFASGTWPNLAALLFALSNLLDHTDGEFARLTGQLSRFGHLYDLASDAVVHILLFVCIGVGLAVSGAGIWSVAAGLAAGISVAAIFHMRNEIENRHGKTATQQPRFGGFEAEDILYLLPGVTMLDGLMAFLTAAAIGAPLAALIVGWHFVQLRRVE